MKQWKADSSENCNIGEIPMFKWSIKEKSWKVTERYCIENLPLVIGYVLLRSKKRRNPRYTNNFCESLRSLFRCRNIESIHQSSIWFRLYWRRLKRSWKLPDLPNLKIDRKNILELLMLTTQIQNFAKSDVLKNTS